MRAALLQLNSSDDPGANLKVTLDYMAQAAAGGASFVLTPEVTNCVSASRARQQEVLQTEAEDQTLAGLRQAAADLGVWLLIGSLGLKTNDPDGRFANRSFLIDPKGKITARYDKMHMFDVQLSETEGYRESSGYRPGSKAVVADVAGVPVGMSVCYDLRFAYLYRALAQAGAKVLTVPSAFAVPTGEAHWHVLLRARAIETGCFVLAPAQTGTHSATEGTARKTFGHSLVVAPWGEVLVDACDAPGVSLVDLDLSAVETARARVPSLTHDQKFEGP